MNLKTWGMVCGVVAWTGLGAAIWDPIIDTHWGTASNWTGGLVPGSVGHEGISAVFPTLLEGPLNVYLDLSIALPSITFNHGYVIIPTGAFSISAPAASTLTITVNPDTSFFPTISADMNFDSMQSLAIVNTTGVLTLSGTTTLTNSTLSQTGPGALIITGFIECATTASPATLGITGDNIQLKGMNSFISLSATGAANSAILTIANSTVTFDDRTSFEITTAGTGDATLIITNSTVTCNGSESTLEPLSGDATITIANSILNMNGSIFNGGQHSIITMDNSTLNMSGFAELIHAANINSTFTISNSSTLTLNDSALIQCTSPFTSASILIQDSHVTNESQGTNSGIISTGTISLNNSTLFSSGLVSAATTYTQDSQSTLEISITTNQNHGLVAAGTLMLDGALLISFPSDAHVALVHGQAIPILTSTNMFNTQFSSHQFINTPSHLVPHLFYSSNDVSVVTAPSPAASAKITTFHATTATERNLRLQRQMTHVHTRLRAEHIPSTLASLPENHEPYTAQNDEILAQQRPSEQLVERMEELPSRPWSAYLGPIGSVGHVNTKDGQPGNSFYSVGVLGGLDYAWMDDSCLPFGLGIGSSCAYVNHHSRVYQHAGEFQIDHVHGNLYAVLVPKDLTTLSVNGAFGGGYEWIHMKRHTGTTASPLTAHGNTKGPEIDALIGMEYLLADDPSRTDPTGLRLIFPVFNVQYARSSLAPFKETEAGVFDLSVEKQKWSALWSFLGTRGSYIFVPTKNVRLRPEVSLGWQRQWNHLDQGMTFATFASPFPQVFSTRLKGPKRDSLIFGFDFNCRMYDTMFIEFDYDLIYNSLFLDNAFYLQFEYMF